MQLCASRAGDFSFFFSGRFQQSAVLVLLILAIAPALGAQQTAPSETQTESHKAESAERKSSEPVALFIMLEKKSIVFPDIAANNARLSARNKFELFVDNSLSLHSLAGATLGAGLSQAADTPHGFGQGGDAYAKRFGSSMARLASSSFFGTFVLASALHQDPRFFAQKAPTFREAARYSVERVFVTRNDDGRDVKNWSGLLGPLFSEGLANAYWPERDRTAAQTFQCYGIDLAVHMGTNMLREYWPPLFQKNLVCTPSQSSVPESQFFCSYPPANGTVTR